MFRALNIASDMCIILLSSYIAWWLRYDVLNGIRSVYAQSSLFVLIVIVYSMFNILVLDLFDVYQPQRIKRIGSNMPRIFLANGICSLLLIVVLYLYKIVNMSRLAIGIWWTLASILICGKHILLHYALRELRKRGYNLRHYVVIGNGHLAHQYVENVRKNPFTGIAVDGYISAVEKPGLGKCLGSYEQLEQILSSNQYDGLVIAMEPHYVRFMTMILETADKEGIQVELIPFYNDYYPSFPTFDSIGSSKLIDLRATPLNQPGNAMLKRTIDIVSSALLLFILSPVMLIVAVGVKLSGPGPVIFKQERIGKNKKPFTMYKFRSMRLTETEDTGWSKDIDPRRTKFGSFIRKYSIDEFPQFWNVLKGDMSLIGPRPEIPYHVLHFKEEIPRYLVRQQVRPGITGWAQVNGLRGDTSIEERVKYDIDYIENWTLGFDIRITFRTIFGAMVNDEELL